MKTTTNYRDEFGRLSNNETNANKDFGLGLVNDALRYLTSKYYINEVEHFDITVAQQQSYELPFNIKQIVSASINVGNIRYVTKESPNRIFWDKLNLTPYFSNIPEYYYIFNKKIYFWPIPSSAGNPIRIVFKRRIRNLSIADYTTGAVAAVNGSPLVNAESGAVFTDAMKDRWIRLNQPNGDGEWYQIRDIVNSAQLELYNDYEGDSVVGCPYVIGEVPLLPEDYQDLPLYRALVIYYTSIVPDPNRANQYKALYDEGFEKLNAEFGSKSSDVAITPHDVEINNPNLYFRY